jgi:hypothetical protein
MYVVTPYVHGLRGFIGRINAHDLLSVRQSDKYVHICWFAPEVGRSAAEHILGTLLVVDGYTGKGKNKHECTRIEGSERNSEDST